MATEIKFTAEFAKLKKAFQDLAGDIDPIIKAMAKMFDVNMIRNYQRQFGPLVQVMSKIRDAHTASKDATAEEKAESEALLSIVNRINGAVFNIIRSKGLEQKAFMETLNLEKESQSQLERKSVFLRDHTIERNKYYTSVQESLNTLRAEVENHGLLGTKLREIEELQQRVKLIKDETTASVSREVVETERYQKVLYDTIYVEERKRELKQQATDRVREELGLNQTVYQTEQAKLNKRLEQLQARYRMIDILKEIQHLENEIKHALAEEKSEEEKLLESLTRKEQKNIAMAKYVNRIGDAKKEELRIQEQINKRAGVMTRQVMEAVNKSKTFSTHLREALKYVFSLETIMKRVSFVLTATLSYRSFYALQNSIKIGTAEAINLEQELANINTLLGKGSEHYIPIYRDAIRKMSREFGEARENLTKGLYDIISASVDASQAINVLEVSVKAARAGLTDASVTADAITTILNAYNMEATEASNVSDDLFTIVKYGKVTLGQLAPVIGNVASSAALLGISFENVGAGIATMTRQGINARNAATALNRFLINVGKNYDLVQRIRQEGIVALLPLIEELSTKEQVSIAGGIRGYKALASAIQNMVMQGRDYEALLNNTGAAQEAFNKNTDTTAFKIAKMKQEATDLARELGYALLPTLDVVVSSLGALSGLLAKNTELITSLVASIALWNLGLGDLNKALKANAQLTIWNSLSGKKAVSGLALVWSKLGNVVKAVGAKLAVLWAGPAKWIILLTAAIFALIKGVKYLRDRKENLIKQEREEIQESKNQLNSIQNKIEKNLELLTSYQTLYDKRKQMIAQNKDLTDVNKQLSSAYDNIKGFIHGATGETEDYTVAIEAANEKAKAYLEDLISIEEIQQAKSISLLKLDIAELEKGVKKSAPHGLFTQWTEGSTAYYDKDQFENWEKISNELLKQKELGDGLEETDRARLKHINKYLSKHRDAYNLELQLIAKRKELSDLQAHDIRKEVSFRHAQEDFNRLISKLKETDMSDEVRRKELYEEVIEAQSRMIENAEDVALTTKTTNKQIELAYKLSGENLKSEIERYEAIADLNKLEHNDGMRKISDLKILQALYTGLYQEIHEKNQEYISKGRDPLKEMAEQELEAKKKMLEIDNEINETLYKRKSIRADIAEGAVDVAIAPVIGASTTSKQDMGLIKTAMEERNAAFNEAAKQYKEKTLSYKLYLQELDKLTSFYKKIAKEGADILKEEIVSLKTQFLKKEATQEDVKKSYEDLIDFYLLSGQELKAAKAKYEMTVFSLGYDKDAEKQRKTQEAELKNDLRKELNGLRAELVKAQSEWVDAGKPIDVNNEYYKAVQNRHDELITFAREKGLELTEAFQIYQKSIFEFGETVEESKMEKLKESIGESITYYEGLSDSTSDYAKELAKADRQQEDFLNKLAGLQNVSDEDKKAIEALIQKLRDLRGEYAKVKLAQENIEKIKDFTFADRQARAYKTITTDIENYVKTIKKAYDEKGATGLFEKLNDSVNSIFDGFSSESIEKKFTKLKDYIDNFNLGQALKNMLTFDIGSTTFGQLFGFGEKFHIEKQIAGLEALKKKEGTSSTMKKVYQASIDELTEEKDQIEMQATIEAAGYITNQLMDIWNNYYAQREAQIEKWYNKRQNEIELQAEYEHRSSVWLNKKQEELDKKKEKRLKKIRKEQRAMDIAQAVVNTAVAVTKALEAGPIIGQILAGIIAGLGAVQIGMIQAQPLALGGIFRGHGKVNGPGTSTSDSINARLSDGEFVTRAAAVNGNEDAYFAMNRDLAGGKDFSAFAAEWLSNRVVIPTSRSYGRAFSEGGKFVSSTSNDNYDIERLEKKIDLLADAMYESGVDVYLNATTLTDLDLVKKVRNGKRRERRYGGS